MRHKHPQTGFIPCLVFTVLALAAIPALLGALALAVTLSPYLCAVGVIAGALVIIISALTNGLFNA